ncbi:MAG: T9SS type A sorting domain-containing protein, partial [Candidatus Pacebacteria bacterium]|nr:T9SS type A sorting domain-containing protein [Candidatus Paceibacterota bacterium]
CTTSPFIGVPNNGGGYQNAATGVAYCGFYSQYVVATVKELIGAQLIAPMIIDNQYYVSLKVSTAFAAGINCATNNLGVLFSTVPYSGGNPAPVNNFAHIYSDSIISDTTNWTTIDGVFTADSSYSYIVIGNFFTDAATDTLILDTGIYCLNPYYFVDDVYVGDTTTGINDLSTSNNIRIYPNPTTGIFTVQGATGEIEVYDMVGGKVLATTKEEIDLSSYAKGIYLIRVGEAVRKIVLH